MTETAPAEYAGCEGEEDNGAEDDMHGCGRLVDTLDAQFSSI